jgi:antiviral helicase SLH1
MDLIVAQAYEEVTIPPAKPVPPKVNERLIPVSELDPLAKGSFPVCQVTIDAS